MKIRIPCTTANLGVLFDKGGIALDAFFNEIVVEESSRTSIDILGEGITSLPRDKSNLVCKAISRFYALTGTREPDYNLS
ncbi:MAG TPA: homoserine kinase, partial [Clostridia bacterium]|nr:homoserine kinase [Clostridia bacterium]